MQKQKIFQLIYFYCPTSCKSNTNFIKYDSCSIYRAGMKILAWQINNFQNSMTKFLLDTERLDRYFLLQPAILNKQGDKKLIFK